MALHDPFDANTTLDSCTCGKHASQTQHDIATAAGDVDALNSRVVQTAVMKALFPHDGERRKFLSAVGASTAWAAISSLIPFGALEAMAQEKGSLEKKDLKVGFIPITCASPLIMADPLGFYKKEGLNVSMVKTAGWALIRDKVLNKEYDASHMLAPMPIAISMGVGSNPSATNVMTIQNINGQAIILATSTRATATRRTGRASSSPSPSNSRSTTCCCATTSPSTASTPTPTCSCVWCRRPKWWPTCAPATSTASSAPIP